MVLIEADPAVMIDHWRRLAALYQRAGNHADYERTNRLADQLEAMVSNETITYSPDPFKREREEKQTRYCRRCVQYLPMSSFGRDAAMKGGFTRYCLLCLAKPPPPVKSHHKKRPKKELDLTVPVNTEHPEEPQNE